MLNKSFSTKTFLIILTTLACSASVMAGMFPDNEENENESIYILGGGAQYFNQSNNLANLTSVSGTLQEIIPAPPPLADPSNSDSYNLMAQNPDKAWGYNIFAGYIFPNHKYDIQASFTSVRADSSNSVGAIPSPEPGGFQVTGAKADASYDFLEADITFGNYIKRHHKLMYRLGYGIAYANIEQKSHENWSAADFSTSPAEMVNINSKYENRFWGVGPKLTFDGQFDVQKYFGIVGGIGVSALYGESKGTFTSTVPEETTEGFANSSEFGEQKDDRIVFGVDAKLGLRFMYLVNDDYNINLEGGYMGVTYFNALQGETFEVDGFSDLGNNSSTLESNENYSNYGPYVTLSVDFM